MPDPNDDKARAVKEREHNRWGVAVATASYLIAIGALGVYLACQLTENTTISGSGDTRTVQQPLGSSLTVSLPPPPNDAKGEQEKGKEEKGKQEKDTEQQQPSKNEHADSAGGSGRTRIKATVSIPSASHTHGHGARWHVSHGTAHRQHSAQATKITVSGTAQAKTATAGKAQGPSSTEPSSTKDASTKDASTEDSDTEDSSAVTKIAATASNDALIAIVALALLIGAGLLGALTRAMTPLPSPPAAPAATLGDDVNNAIDAAARSRQAAERVTNDGSADDKLNANDAVLNARETAKHAQRIADRLTAARYPKATVAKIQKAADDAQASKIEAPDAPPANESATDRAAREEENHKRLVRNARRAGTLATAAAQAASTAVLAGPAGGA